MPDRQRLTTPVQGDSTDATARSPLQQSMAAAIRANLADDGASQADLARFVGVTQKHLSRLLNGRDEGSLVLWSRLLAAMGIVAVDLPFPAPSQVMPWPASNNVDSSAVNRG